MLDSQDSYNQGNKTTTHLPRTSLPSTNTIDTIGKILNIISAIIPPRNLYPCLLVEMMMFSVFVYMRAGGTVSRIHSTFTPTVPESRVSTLESVSSLHQEYGDT